MIKVGALRLSVVFLVVEAIVETTFILVTIINTEVVKIKVNFLAI